MGSELGFYQKTAKTQFFLVKKTKKKFLTEIYPRKFLTCMHIKKQLKILLDFENGSDPKDGIIAITPLYPILGPF